jgi:ABC-type lipoprotein export system ATPase subunit
MLRLTGISKSFIQRGVVLEDLGLELKNGDMVSVSGPSGSGKTTLLNLIGTLDKPDKGDIVFNGVSVLGYDHDQAAGYRNRHIGFVFQDHLLLPHLTILQNIMLPVLADKKRKREFRASEEYALNLMETVGIREISLKLPSQVSGGEAQRAALVRALVNKPSLLLADEPTGSLDKDNAELLGNLLLQVNNQTGVALLLVTHSDSLARKMTKRYHLEKGKLKVTENAVQ